MKPRAQSRVKHFGETYRAVAERVAANVRRLRDDRGWTQEECAHRCRELDLTLLRAIEAGHANLTLATLARLSDGFGIDVREFFEAAPPLIKRPRGRPAKPPPNSADGVPASNEGVLPAQSEDTPPPATPSGE